MKPTIYLATDHAGFAHKNEVRKWLLAENYDVKDCGSHTLDTEDDFTDFIDIAAKAVASNPEHNKAIIFGGSGQGEAMLANRYMGVRAAVYYGGSEEIITLSREHNNANVLSIGARFISTDIAKRVIWKWLHTESFPDEKYARRNNKLREISKKISNFFATEIK